MTTQTLLALQRLAAGTWISGSVLFHLRFQRIALILPQLEIAIAANKPLKSIELFMIRNLRTLPGRLVVSRRFWNAKFNPPL
jgi:hypothetical protein